MLNTIKIVLIETSHSGNIGAVARAMKTMNMYRLCLVSPQCAFPSAEATARAAGADDILTKAEIYSDLASAIADCQLVIGASARDRTISWANLTARQCAEKIANEPPQQVAILFGRENSGLKNHELDCCHYLLRIPCNLEYSSLNIAAAVQVVCYELFISAQIPQTPKKIIGDKYENPLATAEQLESFYQHLQQTLYDIGFMHPDRSKSIMRRLRRLYNRVQLDTKELDILRGILRLSQNKQTK